MSTTLTKDPLSGAYTVKNGDTLSKISSMQGRTLSELLSTNPQYASNPNLIHPGDVIKPSLSSLPGMSNPPSPTPPGASGTSLVPFLPTPTAPTQPAVSSPLEIWKAILTNAQNNNLVTNRNIQGQQGGIADVGIQRFKDAWNDPNLTPSSKASLASSGYSAVEPGHIGLNQQLDLNNKNFENITKQVEIGTNAYQKEQDRIESAAQRAADEAYKKTVLAETVRHNKADERISGQKAGGGTNSTYNGDFGATIDQVANMEPTVSNRASLRSQLQNLIANKDYNSAYNQIANTIESGLVGEAKQRYSNARTDYQVMQGLEKAIKNYTDAGGNTGLLTGTEEQIKRKLGIDSGRASALGTELWREFQTYRNTMTGAAFSAAESRDYASVNPTLGKSLDLNLNIVDGALNQLKNRVESTITSRVPSAKYILDYATGTVPQSVNSGSNIGSTSTGIKYIIR